MGCPEEGWTDGTMDCAITVVTVHLYPTGRADKLRSLCVHNGAQWRLLHCSEEASRSDSSNAKILQAR